MGKTLTQRLNDRINELEGLLAEEAAAKHNEVREGHRTADECDRLRRANKRLREENTALLDQCQSEIQQRMRLQGYVDRIREQDQAVQILKSRTRQEVVEGALNKIESE